MKRIAIISPSLRNGGAERIAGLLSKYLSNSYEVYLFLSDTSNIVYEYSGEIVDIGIGGKGTDYVEYYIDFYKKKYQIDCAISFLQFYNYANIRTRGKEKVIVSERNMRAVSIPEPDHHSQIQTKALYPKADVVVSVSEGVKCNLSQSYGIDVDNIKTIYNFIDKDAIREKSLQKPEDNIDDFIAGSKLIINVGRLLEVKNQVRLIRQFANLIQDGEDVKLLILGSGVLEDELNTLIKELKLERYVKILRYCKNPFPYIKKASIFAFASQKEGLPNVLLEAMCLGIPIVSVDCLSGPRELLAGETDYREETQSFRLCNRGILVTNDVSEDTGETKYLKEAISYMLKNPNYADEVIENEKRYMETYSNEEILRSWIDVIERPQKQETEQIKNDYEKDNKKLVVYGAGDYAKRAVTQLLKDNISIHLIAVSDKKNNPEDICGIPVRDIESLCAYKDEIAVMVGVSWSNQGGVVEKLLSLGFEDIRFLRLRPEI
ncbi:MAG: glycosyltransferase [Lachnospiraceae bacterium]|nr:glycosyltransferase [Lachnospiraceae bacterium]